MSGGAAEFDGTLVSVLQNRPADCEVLVIHTEPYGDPYGLQGEVRFIESSGQSLGGLVNQAIDVAVGEVLHILGCGLEVSEGWVAPALAHFDDRDVAAVSPVIFGPDRKTIAAAGVHWSIGGARRVITDQRTIAPGSGRLRARIHGPTLAAGFYRRDVLVALGGLDAGLGDALADVAVALDIHALGRLHVCEPASHVVLSQQPATIASGLAAGRAVERLFWRHAARSGLWLSMAMHPVVAAADIARSGGRLSSLMGRAAAWFEIGAAYRHEQHLSAAGEKLKELAELRAVVRKKAKPSREAPRRRAA